MTKKFTKKKFFNIPIESQHKKCVEILRIIYESILESNKEPNELIINYLEIIE